MAVQPGVWGIDVGQCALKALRLESIDGQVTATAFDYIEHAKLLNQPDAEADVLTREALETFLSRNSIRGDIVAMSVPGQSGLARFVKLPPVEEKKITDIVKFEAKQQIPFNLNEVVWDYQKIGSGEITDGFAMETEIGLFAIKRDTVNKYLRHFQEVNIEVHIVQMTPLALCNFVSYDLLNREGTQTGEGEESGKKDCIAALDIATDNANLVITDGERIIWQRPIPIGGNHFTRALVKDLKLTFAKAEHLKRNATKSPDLKKILLSLKPVLNDFVNEVHRSLGFFTNTHREANIPYLMGLGSAFRLPGLQKFLSEKLQLEVRKMQKFERLAGDSVISAPVFNENLLSFAPAYGLALQGLKLPRLQTNLLPQDIQVERMIRSKKPMAVAAAAALLVGVGALTFGAAREHRATGAPVIEKAKKDAKTEMQLVAAKAAECENKEKDIEKLEIAVKSVLAGQEECENWVRFNKFLNDRLPKPDGTNLSDVKNLTDVTNRPTSQKKLYWVDPETSAVKGFTAWDKYRKRNEGKGADTQAGDEDVLPDLVQINIEGVNSLYVNDLESVFTRGKYFQELKKDTARRPVGMKEDLDKNPPKGAGWLVEVRGYTYHKDEIRFVLNTLVENLYRAPEEPKASVTEKKDGGAAKTEKKEPADKKEEPAATPDKKDPAATGDKPAAKDTVVKPPPPPVKVSHVFLYAYEAVENPDPVNFKVINKSAVSRLAKLGIAPPKEGEAPEPLPPEAQKVLPPPRPGWKALGATGPDDRGQLNVLTGLVERRPAEEGKEEARNTRTEFILIFVWNEPTPSDKLHSDFGKAPPAEGTPK